MGNLSYTCFVRFSEDDICCQGVNTTKETIAGKKDNSIIDGIFRPRCTANTSAKSTIENKESCEKTVTVLASLLSDLETGNPCELEVKKSFSFVPDIKIIVKPSSELDLLQLIWVESCVFKQNTPANSDKKGKEKLSRNSDKSECNLECYWGHVSPNLENFCTKKLKRNMTDHTAMVTYDGQDILFWERDFEISEDRRDIYVCLSKISPFARIAHHILLPIFCSLSMVSLIVVLILHAVFKELHNLYGFCLVCLSVTLLLTSVLTLFDLFSDSRGSFVVVQVSIHYIWLCVYSWEIAIMHHVYRHFTVDFVANRMNVISIKRQAIYYTLFSTGLPVPFVISGLILHFSSNNYSYYEFEFERIDISSACIIVSPVVILTLTGLTLLLLCLSKIRQMGRNSSLRRSRDSFFIALRLQLTLGLPWIGTLYLIIDDRPIAFLSVVTINSLQGVLIMVAFVTTKRVRGLLQRKNQILPSTE
ncbi:G-protein coupled receptor Mth2 [Holothuria leucospilota]|uniref:G-protein coupled receptor Mth2 n=1 Tax=Holothuria leucospilota TaxID=206669 RepID=A0A9Q1BRL6_HOLLE|nr:G-protein coupled receptor Mth2 [Holothuria leucospilota]